MKLDQAYSLVTKDPSGTVEVLNGFVDQVNELKAAGKLTDDQATALVTAAQQIIANVSYRL